MRDTVATGESLKSSRLPRHGPHCITPLPRPDEMAEKLGMTLEDFDRLAGDATAVSLVSLNKKWYETDSYKDVREIDILEDKKAEDPTCRLQNRDLMRLVTRRTPGTCETTRATSSAAAGDGARPNNVTSPSIDRA